MKKERGRCRDRQTKKRKSRANLYLNNVYVSINIIAYFLLIYVDTKGCMELAALMETENPSWGQICWKHTTERPGGESALTTAAHSMTLQNDKTKHVQKHLENIISLFF